ncbi:GNAT family N-acetyltransferase [Bifidobacterium olomucense]|uniref:GNAT family acetyltransferase n=1 Tax=Bifidobacterium olomucense TaxID=2675324 RepID=A0A7Y0EXL4_9BIFI|nr:GNAT family N-acetyltransferase [Bifidobacterium sp. DSM 109959]NMM98275.1 GNAT family acetyltransferase [Bifidobacterium sp. DSM 109959]
MAYTFRPAEPRDVRSITDIYNASVLAGGSTADLTPRTVEQRREWLESHKPPYGVFVVEATDESTEPDGLPELFGTFDAPSPVVGFGALSVFYNRAGYDGVTDLAYYIAPEWQRKGVGTFLLSNLLDEARSRHMRKACGIIFADNAGSIALMRRFGFTRFGLMPAAAADSTGTMRDMSYWYLDL